ncbi:MAG: flagellar biosynthetic protein FliR, partial [Pseudomonadota bacterium]|nr:flagellar biosynthetic protein FliR [Pseudomonadota bacterium]
MFEELLSLNLFAFFFIFARIGTAFFLFPGFSGKQVSARFRLTIALAVTFVLMPLLMDSVPKMPGSPMLLLLLLLTEILSGAILGTVVVIIFSAVQVAGTTISFVSGMANAMAFDPISQQQSAIVAGFLSTMAVLLLFVTNLHHMLILSLIDSYELFEPGKITDVGDAA